MTDLQFYLGMTALVIVGVASLVVSIGMWAKWYRDKKRMDEYWKDISGGLDE